MDRTLVAITIAAAILSLALFAWAAILVTEDESSQPNFVTDPAAPSELGQFPPPGFEFLTREEQAAAVRETLRTAPPTIPPPPTTVTINGQTLDLPAGMRAYPWVLLAEPGGYFHILRYDGRSFGVTQSELRIDSKEGTISWLEILPEHETVFDPFVRAAGGWPTPTPIPTPILVKLWEHDVVLPDRFVYHPAGPCGHPMVGNCPTIIAYIEPLHVSRLRIDPSGLIVGLEIFPDHADEFAGLLQALYADD